jgi:hypothetical protein
MGAKTWIVAQCDGDLRAALAAHPAPDDAATAAWVAGLFPDRRFGAPRGADLAFTSPPDNTVVAGCFDGLKIVISHEVALDRPSQLPAKFVAAQGTTVLHAMHSVVDWFAFAVWKEGQLQRAFSAAPDHGVIEDIGEPLAFEQPFLRGDHPAVDPADEPGGYPLPFHPLEMGEAALGALFGFQLEGLPDPRMIEPEQVRMLRFGPPGEVPAAAGPDVLRLPASRKKAALLLLGSLAFVALGVWLRAVNPWIGWLSILFFGLGIPASLFMMFSDRIYLLLDPQGFEMGSPIKTVRVAWADVEGFSMTAVQGARMIAIHYGAGYRAQRALRGAARALAGIEGGIANQYALPLDKVLLHLQDWHRRFGGGEHD